MTGLAAYLLAVNIACFGLAMYWHDTVTSTIWACSILFQLFAHVARERNRETYR